MDLKNLMTAPKYSVLADTYVGRNKYPEFQKTEPPQPRLTCVRTVGVSGKAESETVPAASTYFTADSLFYPHSTCAASEAQNAASCRIHQAWRWSRVGLACCLSLR
jgi:hypothetical protein